MPSNYSGDPANITTPLTKTITNCTSGAGGLVLVTTSTSHLFSTPDEVTITGVLGTTEANTTATIQVISSSTFLLNGVPFVHTYSSGGTVKDISLTPYFQIPDDGEAGTVQSIEASIQALADRTQYLRQQVRDHSVVPSQSVTRVQTTTPFSPASNWLPDLSSSSGWTSVTNTGDILCVPLSLPHGCTLTSVTMMVQGPAADVSLPATPIAFKCFKTQATPTGTPAVVFGTTTDPTTPVGNYVLVHNVTVSGLTEVIDNVNFIYFVQIYAESGANSHLGDRFYSLNTTFTVSALDVGAS